MGCVRCSEGSTDAGGAEPGGFAEGERGYSSGGALSCSGQRVPFVVGKAKPGQQPLPKLSSDSRPRGGPGVASFDFDPESEVKHHQAQCRTQRNAGDPG